MLQKTNISKTSHHIFAHWNAKTTPQEVRGFSPFIGRKFVFKTVLSLAVFFKMTKVEFTE